ncbi:hypothetical protein ACP275_01G099200 [Erythranthe tilingii]
MLTILLLLFSFLLTTTNTFSADALDVINSTHVITDGETLISSGGTFELGFFSPGNSKNRYVGVWFKNITAFTVVWVANRNDPITNSSGASLIVTRPGILALVNGSNSVLWSSNSSRVARNPFAKLLDSGNLVVKEGIDNGDDDYLWQSFDYPTDTILQGMKFGVNFVTGHETYVSSWKSSDDPATGDYTYRLDPTGYPQGVLRRGSVKVFNTGPWNGLRYSGMPGLKTSPVFAFDFVFDATEVYYRYTIPDKSLIPRLMLNQSGFVQRWTWIPRNQVWANYKNLPMDNCDSYKQCGVYGICDAQNSPICGCLEKFVPRNPVEWVATDWSNGCERRVALDCGTDGFVKYSGIKLPDTEFSWFNSSMNLEECKEFCLKNCSCVAYTNSDIRNGGSGCLAWFGDLVDIKELYDEGQDIYIRMASSELDSKSKNHKILIVSLTSSLGMILLCTSFVVCIYTRKKIYAKLRKTGRNEESDGKDLELPLFDLSTISKATESFSLNNKLGEGGFGPVYKGTMGGGQQIAVKRLSKTSLQGIKEFKNEVIFIAKLQHRNLVKLLGCCVEGEETMLVYEYMPNKSLDLILFDPFMGKLLDWPKRFQVICGIARGLVYLHQDSRLRIIHRDLKASNILLDTDMNPKISDFGLARSFGVNEIEANTSRVVGTYGYMSPEYAFDGLFSVKSDVYSFGVIVLEIMSGKRNRGYSYMDQRNLLGHAWVLYKEGKSLELLDNNIIESSYVSEMLRSIHVGLLCVQNNPDDRPNMSSVVFMLENEAELTQQPKQPGFFVERDVLPSDTSSTSAYASSANEITTTLPQGR